MSRKPAWETDEYASMRFTSLCAIAARLPIASEATASAATAIVQISDCSGNAVTRIRYMSAEPRDLRRGRHERGHRGRRALVDVGRPHVERRRGDLEAEAGEDHRHAGDEERVVGAGRLLDRGEAELAGRAVDERAAEEQDPRAEAARR